MTESHVMTDSRESHETFDQARERLRPYFEKAGQITGWDFTQVRTRRLPPDMPWDYRAHARALLSTALSVLDIGTAGGELLSALCAGFRGTVIATEGWPPNAPIASQRLRPLNVDVVQCEDEALPFAAASFDLVLNRHSGWNAAEVMRLLRPRGVFFTQQVDNSWPEVRNFFPHRQVDWGHTFVDDVKALKAAGMDIVEAGRHETHVAYRELGDLVINVLLAPWEIIDFDPLDCDLEALLRLEAAYRTADGVVLTEGRAVIEARKPG